MKGTAQPDTIVHPFVALIAHFVRRLFASEEEQGSGSSMGFGVGAVLALVASPGAFASIFLMEKYSTLLEWMRGTHTDPIRRSPSDEYFFIVLSMTITGLVMVARWNRLFPDRRDFANLAVLPIPVRNIFLANLTALLGLALLFGVVVNAVSAILFPFFVTISVGTAAEFLRVATAHAVCVFAASLFSFFAVFSLVGLLTLFAPRALFRPASIFLRVALIVGLLTEFYASMTLRLFSGHVAGSTASYMNWLPSFWFLGIYERMLRIASPAMVRFGREAAIALGAALFVAIGAYALSYRRVFLRLPESFDMLTRSRSFLRIRLPESLLTPLFRSPFERACVTYARCVLLRSEQHLMFLGAYLGIGFVLVAQAWLSIVPMNGDASLPDARTLSLPLLTAFFVTSGLRFTFDLPAAREANWAFRVNSNDWTPAPRVVAKRIMLWATLPWMITVVPFFTAVRWGWAVALLHTTTAIALTVLFIDILLFRFQKIPFTCTWQIEIRQLLTRTLVMLFGLLVIVPSLAEIEHWLLASLPRLGVTLLVLGGAWLWLRKLSATADDGESPIFEDLPGPAFDVLKLT